MGRVWLDIVAWAQTNIRGPKSEDGRFPDTRREMSRRNADTLQLCNIYSFVDGIILHRCAF